MTTLGRILLALEEVEAMVEGVSLVWILITAAIAGFAVAWSIGANDVANTFGTSVGAKVLTMKQALIAASIFEFLGAFLMGSQVANTLRDGIIDPNDYVDNPSELAVGMTSALIGSFFLIFVATYFSLPVSATHSIIGAVMGFALVSVGIEGVKWEEIGYIALSWITSPVISGAIAMSMFLCVRTFILRSANSFQRGLYFMPFCYFFTLAFNIFFIIYKGSDGGFIDLSVIPWWGTLLISIGIGLIIGVLVALFLPKFKKIAIGRYEKKLKEAENKEHQKVEEISVTDQGYDHDHPPHHHHVDHDLEVDHSSAIPADYSLTENQVEKQAILKKKFVPEEFDLKTEELFSFLQVLTACFESFAHGSNDVANAIGPFAVVISVYQTGTVEQDAPIQWWILAAGGVGIVIGLATWGYRVMATIGKDLATVTPSRGFNIELGAAVTVVLGSSLGLPLSTTHCKVGAVVGVGLTEGTTESINWRLVLSVFTGWFVTLPIAAIVSGGVYSILWYFFGWELPEVN